MKQQFKMTLTKSTKGTHVYGNGEPDCAIPTLYIKRGALPSTPPEQITVTVECIHKVKQS